MNVCPQDTVNHEQKAHESVSTANKTNENYEKSDLSKISHTSDEFINSKTSQSETQNEDEGEIKIGKLFVGGLPFTSNDNALYDYFIQFGDIKEAVVIRDRITGASKGYGFVTMKDHQSATEALRNPNPYIDGRRCNINYAFKNTKKREKIYHDGVPRYRHQYIQQQPLWNFGFDPYSLYDYRQQPYNFINYPCNYFIKIDQLDNANMNVYAGYESRQEIPFQQIYSQFIPLSFTTPNGSHLAAFYHPYPNNSAIYEIPIDKKHQQSNPETLVDELKNINISQNCDDQNHIQSDSTPNAQEKNKSDISSDNSQQISSKNSEENIKTLSQPKNILSKDEQWKNRKYKKNVKITDNDRDKLNY